MDMKGTSDDVGKKRGSLQVVESDGGPRVDKNPKKPKARKKIRKKESPGRSEDPAEKLAFAERLQTLSVSGSVPQQLEAGKLKYTTEKPPTVTQENQPKQQPDNRTKVSWDLESALHHIVRIGGDEKEFLSKDDWVSFRVGHSGDATMLEKHCSKTSKENSNAAGEGSSTKEDSSSPVASKDTRCRSEQRVSFLADGLGGEERTPSVFALLAEVSSLDTNNILKAAVLFTGDEVLGRIRLKKLYVDKDYAYTQLLERRVWLRLSALAVLVGYDIVFDSDTE